jgi:hypothetical protein
MADMDAIRRFVQDAEVREVGDDDTRMARFAQELETFLTPDVFQSFGFAFDWATGGARGREPQAKSELAKSTVWFYEGTDHHRFDASLMGKTAAAFTSRRHVDSKDEFLKMLQGWV